MSVLHHPSDDVILAYAAGGMDRARRIVVATHLLTCPHCRRAVAALEAVGGEALVAAEPTPMRGGFSVFAARLDQCQPVARAPLHVDDDVPATIGGLVDEPWRKITGTVAWRPVLDEKGGTRLFMLRAGGGTKLPRHRHTGIEWTCVLKGAYRHAGGRYGPGDFDEADEAIEHHPDVENGEPCVCLIALRGTVRLQGIVGRILQPLIRF